MQRKITWILSLTMLCVAAVIGVSFFDSKTQNQNSSQAGEKEFSDFVSGKKKLPQIGEEVSLIAVGDISYSRGVERIVERQKDINYPFWEIGEYLRGADLVFGNLEAPITEGAKIPDFSMLFRSNPGTEQALRQAGFSILSLANNHTPNFGEKGLVDTFGYLARAGIKYAGAGKDEKEAYQPVYIEKKGMKFAFLAYNDTDVVPASYEASQNLAGTAFKRINKMTEAVKEAKKNSDITIVSMHAGDEYTSKPNESQIKFARAAIDAGADLVIGHHPHVVQTMGKYKGKYIFYSLGNFVFDQPQSQETKEGLAIKVYFSKNGINNISFLPVVMENLAQPKMAKSDEAGKILKKLEFPLANQTAYFWDGNNFQKSMRAVVYGERENRNISIKQKQSDLDKNSVLENYQLENGKLTITENEKMIWQSPDDWWIDNFVLADSNNDGVVDLNLSLWKSGSFGPSKPFWVKENDMGVKNHFFVFDFADGAMKPIWQSSNLAQPNCEFDFADVDGDGKNELVVIEDDYSQKPKCEGNYIAVWKWNGWGFSNEWRSENNNFSNLKIVHIGDKTEIVADGY
jgi:poly-gamma-glutamate synthesis protein (capsule biosynthesis protein)